MKYLTIADIEAYTGITYTAEQEALLDSIETALASQMERYCNRTFDGEEYVEKFDGGFDTFLVANPPITDPSVQEDGEDLVENEDFFNYGSYIKLAANAFVGNQNIEITYIGGGLPEALKQALIVWVLEVYETQLAGGGATVEVGEVKSVGVGPVSVTYGSPDSSEGSQTSSSSGLLSGVPEEVADVLRLYRKNPL